MQADAGADHRDKYAAFRHGPFLRFWLSRFLATFSTQIVSVAVGWQIYDLTRDPFDLGLVGLIQFAPSLLLVLVTGPSPTVSAAAASWACRPPPKRPAPPPS